MHSLQTDILISADPCHDITAESCQPCKFDLFHIALFSSLNNLSYSTAITAPLYSKTPMLFYHEFVIPSRKFFVFMDSFYGFYAHSSLGGKVTYIRFTAGLKE
jgi:hypothetical protein